MAIVFMGLYHRDDISLKIVAHIWPLSDPEARLGRGQDSRLLAVTGQPRSASEVTWLTTQRGWANSGYRALPTETILNKQSACKTPMTVYKAERDTWAELNNALFTSFSF